MTKNNQQTLVTFTDLFSLFYIFFSHWNYTLARVRTPLRAYESSIANKTSLIADVLRLIGDRCLLLQLVTPYAIV